MEPIVKDKNSTKGLDHDKCKVIYFNVYLEVYLKQLEAISQVRRLLISMKLIGPQNLISVRFFFFSLFVI